MISLARLLALAFGLVLVGGFSALFYLGFSNTERSINARLNDLADRAIGEVEEELRVQLRPVEELLDYLARENAGWQLDSSDSAHLIDSLNAAVAATPQVDGIGFYGVAGGAVYVDRNQCRHCSSCGRGPSRDQRFCGHPLHCRIGINSGPLVAGSVGARERLSYTVHGDAVNLAARLEAMNKTLATQILISESTAQALERVRLVRVGEVPIRGREAPVCLYTLAAKA